MARALELNNLLRQPESQRDDSWERAFLQTFPEGRLEVVQDTPQAGPDGWPYLMAESVAAGGEPVTKVVQWLADKGVGLCLNPFKEAPDFVFSYGMIWNFHERSEFLSSHGVTKAGSVEFEQGKKVLAGPPSAEFLPTYVRNILRQFLKDQKIAEPKILVISDDQKHFNLCFSLESLGAPPEHEHKGVAEALAWFLPMHYSIVLVKEEGMPPFVSL